MPRYIFSKATIIELEEKIENKEKNYQRSDFLTSEQKSNRTLQCNDFCNGSSFGHFQTG